MNFIFAQVSGAIALILVAISYFFKNKDKFLLLQIVANIFYGASFIFNNALIFGINSLISIIRVCIIYFFEKNNKEIPVYLPMFFSVVYILVGIIFYENLIDIIGIITPIIFTIAMCKKNMQHVRILMLIPNILLVISALIYKVYTTALLDLIEVIVIIVAILHFYIQSKKIKYLL